VARSKAEVKAIEDLLLQDWETPELLAATIIDTLDQVRATKTRYVGVMQFGRTHPFYMGVGPYPGRKSAQNALVRHPAASEATALAVVPMMSDEGFKALLEDLDRVPESVVRETATSKKEANQKFASMMSKDRLHIVVRNAGDIKVRRS
jgi:hypothetical protein